MKHPPGAVSVAELVLALWLTGLVLLGLSTFLARQGRMAAGQRDLVRFLDARRIAEVVLGGELRALTAADIHAHGASSLRLRAVRGSGPVCRSEADEVDLDYRGVRLPDPRKDSLLLLGGGVEQTLAMTAVAGAPCGEGGLRITLAGRPAGMPRFALLFESGAYHADGGTLRYAIGAGGRQPLTEAVFDDVAFERLPGSAGYLLLLAVHPDSLPAAPRRVRIAAPLLNGARGDDP